MEDRTPNRARRRHRKITEQIAELGLVLPGSIVERYTRCGKPTCRCHADPTQRHGPYAIWTRKIAGKTVTRTLTADETARYRPWIENNRRLRALITDLETIAINLADHPAPK